jgi:hypothetical protein
MKPDEHNSIPPRMNASNFEKRNSVFYIILSLRSAFFVLSFE